jgi:orotate phosphoribosyltransferase-like protein
MIIYDIYHNKSVDDKNQGINEIICNMQRFEVYVITGIIIVTLPLAAMVSDKK